MAAAAAQVSAFLCFSAHDVPAVSPARAYAVSRLPTSSFARKRTAFATGSSLLISRTSNRGKPASRTASVSIRCEQSTQEGSSLDVWLGRLAMVGFAVAISVEIATGKGLLEVQPGAACKYQSDNFGLTTPLPTVALALTGVVGILTAIFIFQSASKN